MPRESIVGSGRRGFGFEQKGFQERNLALLLDTLSKKETQKSIEALSKIDKDEWNAIAITATTLNNFVTLGGVNTLTNSVKETIKLQIESILSPLTNEINQAMTEILTPFINDILTPVINELNTFLSENQTGAGAGGIIGGVIGAFTPLGPVVGGIVGALIGALIESGYGAVGDVIESAPEGAPFKPNMIALYEAETGNIFTSILDWQYIAWYNSRSGSSSPGMIGGGSTSGTSGGGIGGRLSEFENF